MDHQPHVLDNLSSETGHAEALTFLVGDVGPEHALAVATGYVNLAGLQHLAGLSDGRRVRLLIGAEPAPGLGGDFSALSLFEHHRVQLRRERDLSRFPPSRAARSLAAVSAWLDRPEVEVRRYVKQFLHGKAYLLGDAPGARVALVTSANLTGGGLYGNLELGVTSYGPPVADAVVSWFDDRWADAHDYEDELRELLFPEVGLLDPQTIYLRALLDLQEPVPDEPERLTRPALELAPFQRDGYERARVIAKRHHGVIYADGVGTGKTEIGLAFVEERIKEDGLYALVIAPAQLAKRWDERIQQAKLSAQVVSFNALAADEQLAPEATNRRRVLHSTKDSYRLVIVDEAHALRNEDTSWYRAMERLLGGVQKDVVLLTATPINNGLWDLYSLVMLFARHDKAFAAHGIDSIRELFLTAGANERDPEALAPEVLFPLADAVSVRRDRAFIESEYPNQQFPDGTPVRFPTPRLRTHRYDLDAAHPGLLDTIATLIDALTMARYRPSAFELGREELAGEAQLGGLLKSGVLKRFESCWRACLETVEHMLAAHDAFLISWERGLVPDRETLREAARADLDEAGLAGWMEQQLEAGVGARPTAEFDPAYGDTVREDRDRLEAIRAELSQLRAEDDPKLTTLRDLLEASPAEKIVVFATFGATVRYLDEHLPTLVGGRERVVVIGSESTPDGRMEALSRFAPDTVVRPGYEPPAGQIGLLLSTDVLAEGQNLQQAQAVVSYDMPWNPQRVVQRNGRVIRLRSPHDEVLLTTMLPEPGELERLLGIEARIQVKITAAAGVYGMESEVIEGRVEGELRAFAERLAAGDEGLLTEAEEESGAFVGEALRRLVDRAVREGEVERVMRLPWGVGACFRQTPAGRSRGAPGVFFAIRTPPMPAEPDGRRYWRYVETDGEALVSTDLEILRRIDPEGGVALADGPPDVELEQAWQLAAADVVAAHNARSDLRTEQEAIGPRQRWALEVLRDPGVAYATGADLAEEALSVGRSSAVRRALGDVQAEVAAGQLTLDDAAARIVDVVQRFGLQPVVPPPLPTPVTIDDLAVVCWMAVVGH